MAHAVVTHNRTINIYVFFLYIACYSLSTQASLTAAKRPGCPRQQFPADPGLGPAPRAIVDDMTMTMRQILQQHGIKTLLVLPKYTQHPAKADLQMNIDLQAASGDTVQMITILRPSDLKASWHGRLQQQDPLQRSTLRHQQQHSSHSRTRASVALFLQAHNSNVTPRQMALVAMLTKRLRNSHSITFIYSAHTTVTDSLLVTTSEGEPLGVALLSTSLFRDAFTKVYATKAWGPAGGGSGVGSDLNKMTKTVRTVLPSIIKKYNITTMLDSSCGSMMWMPEVVKKTTAQNLDFKFMGTDVVCDLIKKHKATFAEAANMKFACIDYASERIPCGFDMVWSRDSLQHVPLYAVYNFLNNVKASGAKYLLVGSYLSSETPNRDVKGGGYFPINLLKPPFNMSEPLEVIDEETPAGEAHKYLLLFRVSQMTWQDSLPGLMRR